MHLAFIPYGARWEVENLLREMEAQKHWLPMTKGKESRKMPMSGQIRALPLGVYEYIFPKESLNLVLSALKKGYDNYYYISKTKQKLIRRILKLKPLPRKFDDSQKYIWNTDAMSVILLGIKEDNDVTDKHGEMIGWTHEGF